MKTITGTTPRRLAWAAAAAALASLLASAAPAAAATAPLAITGPVSATGATSATLTGTVNPQGDATTWHFDYGKTTSYGTSTSSTSAGSVTTNVGVASTLSGLSPATAYHYRLVASNGGGTTLGADGIFTTSGAPAAPTVVTSAATSVSSSSATLNGSVNPNGQETSYHFEYGKTTSYGTQTTSQDAGNGATAATVSASISGLETNQIYHFRLVAQSSAGTTHGPDLTLTPSSGPSVTTKPASSVSASSAKLNGTVNPHGLATTYYFDYGTTTGYGSKTPVTSVGSGTGTSNVTATLNGLAPGVYHFRLVASSSAGTVSGSDVTFGSGPPAVQTGTAQGATTNSVTLTGSVNPEGNSTTWYFDYGTTAAYGARTAAKSAGSGSSPTGVSAAVTKLAAGATYHYRLVAQSGSGTVVGNDVTVTTLAAVTIASSTLQSVYGHYTTLTGVVASRQQGVTVSMLQEEFGTSAFTTIGTALTGGGGAWSFQVRPRVATTYEASTSEGTSTPVTVGVRPAVSLRKITKARFSTRVVTSRTFAGKFVQLQLALPEGRWKTIAKARLNAKSSAVFAASRLPHGTSTIRIAMSVNQAGPGYLGAFSRTISYHRA